MLTTLTQNLRHRITIQKKKIEQDAFGEYKETWENCFSLWAWVHPLQSGLASVASSEHRAHGEKPPAYPRYRMRFRYGISLDPGSRLLWKDRLLVLISTPVINFQKQWVDYYAQEITKSS